MTCLFCNIANGTLNTKRLYEDELVIAFEDINPQAPTHLLIIPKLHIENINAIEPEHAPLLAHLLFTAKQLAHTLNLSENGYRLVLNTNEHGGQTVYHLHLHLLGGRPFSWPPG
ncbi:MAG: histidine triad nucleotide-binding protein [Gammaproteobacteria bacterium]|nr:histidine triad nucleotide-binding protein [Gammaproteobacteria bacterium]